MGELRRETERRAVKRIWRNITDELPGEIGVPLLVYGRKTPEHEWEVAIDWVEANWGTQVWWKNHQEVTRWALPTDVPNPEVENDHTDPS